MTAEGLLRLDGSCVEPAPPIFDPESRRFTRLDALWLTIWLVFLGGLAVPLYLAGWLLIPEEGSDTSVAEDLLARERAR